MFRFGKLFALALLILAPLAMPFSAPAQISVGVAVHIGPPALPVYAQPVCPGVGYIWTPGYWAYGDDGYFWVPGTWVLAPTPGYLWTPGYWGWGGGGYFWHGGYWGPHVGFYGGINYGFGYTGVGFFGGEWRGGVYHYNTAVTNVNTTIIHNTYNTTVVNNNTTINRVSYNGGAGGVTVQPTAAEQAAAREHHMQPTALQQQHHQAASTNRALLASENHGQPVVAATPKPGQFSGHGVVAARASGTSASHPMNRPNTGNAHANVQTDRPPNARNNGTSRNPNNLSSTTNSNKPNSSTNLNRPNSTYSNSKPNAGPSVNRPNITQPRNPDVNRAPSGNTSHPNTTQPSHPNTARPPQTHVNTTQPPQSHLNTAQPKTNHPSEQHHESGGRPGGRGR